MRHSSIWKLISAISVCKTLTVGVHLSSTPSISGPGSATAAVSVVMTRTQKGLYILLLTVDLKGIAKLLDGFK